MHVKGTTQVPDSESESERPPTFVVWMLVVLAVLMGATGLLNHRDRHNRESLEKVDVNTTKRPF